MTLNSWPVFVMSHDLPQTIPTAVFHRPSAHWGLEQNYTSFQELIVWLSSHLCTLLVMLRVFTPQDLADSTNQGFPSPSCTSEPAIKHLPICHCHESCFSIMCHLSKAKQFMEKLILICLFSTSPQRDGKLRFCIGLARQFCNTRQTYRLAVHLCFPPPHSNSSTHYDENMNTLDNGWGTSHHDDGKWLVHGPWRYCGRESEALAFQLPGSDASQPLGKD